MTATRTRPAKKTKSAERAAAPPPDKKSEAKANGKAAKPAPSKEDRVLESYPRMVKLHAESKKARERLKEAESDLEDAREEVKKKEQDLEELDRKIHQVIEEIEYPSPLYNAPAMPNGNGKTTGPDVELKEDDSWRAVSIKSAMPHLGKKVYDGMESKGLKTMGDLTDWQNKNDGWNWLTDIPGVGKAAVDKISDAQLEFLEKWRKENPPKPVAVDPLEKVKAVALADLPILKEHQPLLGRLHLAGVKTIGDLTARMGKEKKSMLDTLRGLDFDLARADTIKSAIEARAKEADKPATKTEPLKAGNSSQPVDKPLLDPKNLPEGVKTVDDLQDAVKGKKGGK